MRVDATLRLMRMFNVVAAAALGAAALAAARRTRLAIAGTLLLPMSVALAASASQDSLMIPLAALAVALIDLARAEPQRADPRLFLAAGLALMLVLLARPPYLPLSLLLLLLPGRHGLKWCLMLGVTVATLIWSAYVSARIAVPMNGADPARQLAFILHHPFGLANAFIESLRSYWYFYVASAIGVLGWLDTWLPMQFISGTALILPLLLLSATTPDRIHEPGWRGRTALGMLAAIGAAMALFLSLYLVWSAPGAPRIEGIQGRYFLPLLPALALALPSLGRWAGALRWPSLAAVLLLAATTPPVMLTALVFRYYVSP